MVFVILLTTGCGATDVDTDRRVAVNAQLEANSGDIAALADELAALADQYGGEVSQPLERDPVSVELRIPVTRWPEAFAALQARPEAVGGEQVWGQDITDQITELQRELAAATGEEAARLWALLEFRFDRIERATIVVRIRPPG